VNTEEKLIENLFSVGERLPPRLKEEIVSRGPAIEPQLRRLIDEDELFNIDARGKGWAPIHAVTLLGAMRAAESIPRMIALLASSDCADYVWDRSLQALQAMGAVALEPCLAAHAAADDDEVRSSLASVMCELRVKDERVLALLTERLERHDGEVGIAACDLASYGDAQALPNLARVLDRYEIDADGDNPFTGQDVIELCAAIEDLGGSLTELQQRKRKRILSLRSGALRAPAESDASDEARPGRNAPCWCGSGNKYKRCHLVADEQQDRDAVD